MRRIRPANSPEELSFNARTAGHLFNFQAGYSFRGILEAASMTKPERKPLKPRETIS